MRLFIVAGLLAAGAAGCAPVYAPLSSHTLNVGDPAPDEDVVWVTRDSVQILRCSNTAQGPVCVTAQSR